MGKLSVTPSTDYRYGYVYMYTVLDVSLLDQVGLEKGTVNRIHFARRVWKGYKCSFCTESVEQKSF